MNRPLIGPADRYRVRVELLDPSGRQPGVQRSVDGGGKLDKAGGDRFMVMLGDVCALVLLLGHNGITVEQVLLIQPSRAVVRAVVTPGSGAPDWLPNESTYLLFDGDQRAARDAAPRYLPLEGMVEDRSWPREESVPLDSVAVAVGQAINRANARLTQPCDLPGGALVQSVTVRLAVQQADICKGRLLVTLDPAPGAGSQFVELTLGTNAAAAGLEEAEELAADEPLP
jgi:hypothetical protein